MATLKLDHVKKIYDGNVIAVHDFDIDIKDGEFIVIVGPSGCGKSTTLRMIAGLEEMAPLLPVVNGLNSGQFTWCVILLILACLSMVGAGIVSILKANKLQAHLAKLQEKR